MASPGKICQAGGSGLTRPARAASPPRNRISRSGSAGWAASSASRLAGSRSSSRRSMRPRTGRPPARRLRSVRHAAIGSSGGRSARATGQARGMLARTACGWPGRPGTRAGAWRCARSIAAAARPASKAGPPDRSSDWARTTSAWSARRRGMRRRRGRQEARLVDQDEPAGQIVDFPVESVPRYAPGPAGRCARARAPTPAGPGRAATAARAAASCAARLARCEAMVSATSPEPPELPGQNEIEIVSPGPAAHGSSLRPRR